MKGHLKLRLKDSLTNLNLNHYSCSVSPIGNGRKVLKKTTKKTQIFPSCSCLWPNLKFRGILKKLKTEVRLSVCLSVCLFVSNKRQNG